MSVEGTNFVPSSAQLFFFFKCADTTVSGEGCGAGRLRSGQSPSGHREVRSLVWVFEWI